MPHHPQIIAASSFVRRLALFYSAIFISIGVQMPFFPLWLETKGLSARAIGFVLAVPMVVRVFAIPVVTRQADHRRALQGTLAAASIMTAIGFTAMGFAEGSLAIFVIAGLVSIASTPIMPLADAYALRGLAHHGRAYGSVRLWGSAAFIAGSLGTGWMIDSIAPRNVIWLIAAAWVAAAVYAVRLFPLAGTPAPEGTEPSHLELLRRPGFIAVAVAAGLIQASHAVYYGFSTLDWSAAGLDGTAVGMLWALGVVAEITLFALSGRLPPALGPAALLLLGAVGAVVRWTVMAFDPPTLALPFLQCLHALSFGATYLGALGFVAQAAPPGLAATAQGYLATVLGGLMAVSMGLSGVLYAAFGSLAYLAMAVLAAAGGVFALMARQSAPQSPP